MVSLDLGVDEGPDDRLLPPGSPALVRQPEIGFGFNHVRPLPLEGVLQVAGVDLEAELLRALGVEGARGLFELEQGAGHVEGDQPPQPRHGSVFCAAPTSSSDTAQSRTDRELRPYFSPSRLVYIQLRELCNLRRLWRAPL